MKWFIYLVYRLLASTWRIHVIEPPLLCQRLTEKKPVIFAHWHGDEMAIIHLVKRYKLATMTSTSSDGSIIDFAIRKFGGATSRGSSTRGGVSALKGLIRLVKSGRNASIAVDGPRGPFHEPKAGVFELSRICQAPIVATGVAANRVHVFKKSWNKAFLPLPFAKVVVLFEEPIAPQTTRHLDEMNSLLKTSLDTAQQSARNIIAAC